MCSIGPKGERGKGLLEHRASVARNASPGGNLNSCTSNVQQSIRGSGNLGAFLNLSVEGFKVRNFKAS